jgi:hypothetical protein
VPGPQPTDARAESEKWVERPTQGADCVASIDEPTEVAAVTDNAGGEPLKKQVAAWIMSGVLVAGAGVAIAATDPGDPDLCTPDTTLAPTTTTAESDGLAGVTDDTEAPDVEADVEGTHPDNHGAVVSEAAHDHSHDAECGNHGAWVKAVAHGDETCAAVSDAQSSSVEGDDSEADDDEADEVDEVESDDSEADDSADATTVTATDSEDAGHGHGHGK